MNALVSRRPTAFISWAHGDDAWQETIARFTRREPLVTLDALRMSKYRMFFTTAKAERDLGLTARPFTEALADAIDWFRGAGYIKR